MTIMLALVCSIMPVHLAFAIESKSWCLTYLFVDTFFLIDIVIAFFTTYEVVTDEETKEIIDRVEIATKYLKSWFVIDIISIFPVDLLVSSYVGEPNFCPTNIEHNQDASANGLLRFPKIIKIFRTIRIIRMLKIFKLMKNKKHLEKQFHNGLAVSSGVERIVILAITSTFSIHLMACGWIYLGVYESDVRNTWYSPSMQNRGIF